MKRKDVYCQQLFYVFNFSFFIMFWFLVFYL